MRDISILKLKGKRLTNKKQLTSSVVPYVAETGSTGRMYWVDEHRQYNASPSQRMNSEKQVRAGKYEDISQSRKVYIAGPMTGYEGYNYDAFNTAAKEWRAKGWEVFNPAETDNGSKDKGRAFYLRNDLQYIAKVDAVAFLPGWEKSKGATLENHIALELGVDRYNAITFELLSDEGRKDDDVKLRYDLLPSRALESLAAVYTFGAKKYADRNWEKGIRWGRVFGAIMRHLWAFWKGEDNDPETGLPHPTHAAWGCFALIEYMTTHRDKDDRSS